MDKFEVLKQYWGFDAFRPQQESIVDHVLAGGDALALLPTGGGKSLCYQLPALMMDGICLVVSPLIALMKDQVEHLRRRGIKAACLTSGISTAEAEIVLNNCLYGKVKLLYVSPERLRNKLFINYFRRMKVSFVAVDEAHCISQWGYDFRPSYLQVADVRLHHPGVPILALTATATPEVVKDIMEKLQLRGNTLFQSSFHRENLAYLVIHDADKRGRLLRIIRTVGGAGVVYVRNRRRTQETADFLAHEGIRATYYHAGLTAVERDVRQREWMNSPEGVIVATNAFGMGIDRPDVRFVIHLDVPSSLEAYFQEAGRAGRDGKKAYAVLLVDGGDASRLDIAVETTYPPMEYVRNVYRAVCNYYNVPVGSGCDTRYDFDIQSICSTYGLDVTMFYSSMKLLEAEGLVSLPDRNDPYSKLHLLLDRDEAYRYQVEHVREGNLLQVVMRMYGGVTSDYVDINERELARKLYAEPDLIYATLRQMAEQGVVAYRPVTTRPQIIFTANRIDVASLYLSDSNYRLLKQAAQRRVDTMKRYLADDSTCRSRQLLAYFGEQRDTDCGVCDVCLERHKKAPADAEAWVREQLAASSRSMKALQEAAPALEPDAVAEAVRTMVDRGEVTIDGDLNIHLTR